VPFGTPEEAPRATARVLKGVVPGIGPDDKVVLWGGGVYNWFDPITLVRAVDRLHRRRPGTRLFFLGMAHPNPEVPEMRAARETRALCDQLGLTGRVVFFNEQWVPYEQRQNYLLESDVGVSTHHSHLETEFSFRTRIMDYLWAGLPVVTSGGDALGGLVEEAGLGRTVRPGDVEGLELALDAMLFDDKAIAVARANVTRLQPTLTWERALDPLLEFCRQPVRAPDLVAKIGSADLPRRRFAPTQATLRDELARARLLLGEGGPGYVARRAIGKIRRAAGRRASR
jgi:glycosyltransferase involved in cell wall biosynthesis